MMTIWPEPENAESMLNAAGLVHTRDELVNSILEDEDELIAAHRRQIEDTMAIVRLEMNLLAEVCACLWLHL